MQQPWVSGCMLFKSQSIQNNHHGRFKRWYIYLFVETNLIVIMILIILLWRHRCLMLWHSKRDAKLDDIALITRKQNTAPPVRENRDCFSFYDILSNRNEIAGEHWSYWAIHLDIATSAHDVNACKVLFADEKFWISILDVHQVQFPELQLYNI
jgi:hypothetical protein